MNKLDIKNVLTVSVEAYKARWKQLVLITLFSAIISVSVDMIGITAKTMPLSQVKIRLQLMYLILIIISTYFTSRLTISLILASKAALCDEKIVISDLYSDARPLTWRVIGFSLLLYLMLLMPLSLPIIGVITGMSWSVMAMLIILGGVPAIYIFTIFRYSIFAAVLYPHMSTVFIYSSNLVKGYLLKVFIIMLIPAIISSPILIFYFLFNVSHANVFVQLAVLIIRTIPSTFIIPFGVLLNLTAMRNLENIKNSIEQFK